MTQAIGDFGAAALEFDKNGGLQGVAGVRFATAVEDGNERGVRRIDLARVDLTAFFRISGDRKLRRGADC